MQKKKKKDAFCAATSDLSLGMSQYFVEELE